MGCGVWWSQINELERAIGSLRRLGISELSPAYKELSSLRGKLLKQVGFKFPRTVTQLIKLVGMSPGVITLWHDVESGWLVEARRTPQSPPVYHYVGDETAVAVLNKALSPEQEETLMMPDEYYGEE